MSAWGPPFMQMYFELSKAIFMFLSIAVIGEKMVIWWILTQKIEIILYMVRDNNNNKKNLDAEIIH